MPALDLSIPGLATRRPGSAVASVPITNMVIEGDSQTSTTPDQATNRGDFYSYTYADDLANSAVTFHVRGQASRTVGGGAYSGPPPEGADTGTPASNTLLDHRSEDIGYGPQLLTAMLGSNDFAPFSVDNTMAKLVSYAPTLRASGAKFAIVAPPPYHPSNASYATFNPKWLDYIGRLRNPAVRSTFADYYIPLGEHPDLRDPALVDTMFNAGDLLHMTPGASLATSGQYRAYAVYKAAVDTLRDLTRATSTSMYSAAWPASETNLAAGATIKRRVMVKGIAHAGLTSGASVTGPSGTTISLNGGTAGSSVGTGSGNGYAIYPGDVLEITIPLSALNNTAVSIDLTIGSETRTISYTTVAAVTPATYSHQGIQNVQAASSVHTITSAAFADIGMAVLFVYSGGTPTGVSVGGVAATQKSLAYNWSLWTVPITATGARDIVITHSGSTGQTTTSWGVVKNADATPTQIDLGYVASESDPHSTSALTVPASGIAVCALFKYGAGGATVAGTGNTGIGEGGGTYLGETLGLAVSIRTTTGAGSWTFGFGTFGRGALVFKAAGT